MSVTIVVKDQRCRLCNQLQDIEQFYLRQDNGKRHTACATCLSAKATQRNKDKREDRNAYMRQYLRDAKDGTRDRPSVTAIMCAKKRPCTDCGHCFPPECMDFDHTGDDKARNVSAMACYTLEKVLAEIAKCEIVCANCHRTRTKNRLLQSVAVPTL